MEKYFDTDHLKNNLKSKAMRSAGATIFASGLIFFVQLFSTVILARLLTPNDFGLITMVTTFSMLLQNFGLNGFTEAIIQRDDINHQTISTLFWVNISISLLLTLLFVFLSPVLAWFYTTPELSSITTGIAFSIIATGVGTIHSALMRRNMQFYLISTIEMVSAFIGLFIAIIMAWQGFGYWALVANIVIRPVIFTVCSWIFCGWRPGAPGPLKEIFPILKFAIHTYGNFTLQYFSRNIDKLLIGWRHDAQSVGHYKKAYDLFALPASQLIVPIHNVALATLSRLTNEPDNYRRYYLSAISIIAFVAMPLSAMMTLAGKDIILFILGPQWTKAGIIFCYFGVSIGVMLIYATQGWLHLSLGQPERWLRWCIFECIATTAFFIVGVRWGAEGVAIGYAASFYVLLGPCLLYAGRPINLKLNSIISAVWKYFASSALAGVLSFFILYKIPYLHAFFYKQHVFLKIMIASILCGTLYLLLIILFYQGISPITNFFSTTRQMIPFKKS